jgi:argonaute-like protein implicated in RNA metabolism and viral defense
VGRIAVVNKEKVDRVEMMLIQMAQKGQIREKVSEAKIVQMLEQVAEMDSKMTVTTLRTGGGGPSPFDDDEEDPIAKAMAMGARIPGQDDSSDDY